MSYTGKSNTEKSETEYKNFSIENYFFLFTIKRTVNAIKNARAKNAKIMESIPNKVKNNSDVEKL